MCLQRKRKEAQNVKGREEKKELLGGEQVSSCLWLETEVTVDSRVSSLLLNEYFPALHEQVIQEVGRFSCMLVALQVTAGRVGGLWERKVHYPIKMIITPIYLFYMGK